MTISPSERHSGLVLRLSRVRRNDPIVQESEWTGPVSAAQTVELSSRNKLSTTIGRDTPKLERSSGVDDAEAYAELPHFHVRRKRTAQDPRAVVAAFDVHVRMVLPRLMGLRTCPRGRLSTTSWSGQSTTSSESQGFVWGVCLDRACRTRQRWCGG